MNKDTFIAQLVAHASSKPRIEALLTKYGLLRNTLSIEKLPELQNANLIEFNLSKVSEIVDLEELPALIFSRLVELEDAFLFDKIDTAIYAGDTKTSIAGELTSSTFETSRYFLERNKLIVDKIIINRHDWVGIFSGMKNVVDPCTDRQQLLDGNLGYIYGSKLMTISNNRPESVPMAHMYAVASPEFLGTLQLGELFISYNQKTDTLQVSELLIVTVNENAVSKTVRIDTLDKIAKESINEQEI